jgi:putative transposase
VLSEHAYKIAPNTYWVAKKRPRCARAVCDEMLKVEIARVHGENLEVYGANKVEGRQWSIWLTSARC